MASRTTTWESHCLTEFVERRTSRRAPPVSNPVRVDHAGALRTGLLSATPHLALRLGNPFYYRATEFAFRMVAWSILLRGPPRLIAGMFILVGVALLGIGALLLLGTPGPAAVQLYLVVSIALLCLGIVMAGFGIVWLRQSPPPRGASSR